MRNIIHSYWTMCLLPLLILILTLVYMTLFTTESIVSVLSAPTLLVCISGAFLIVLDIKSIEVYTFVIGLITLVFSTIQSAAAVTLNESTLFPMLILITAALVVTINILHINSPEGLSWDFYIKESPSIDKKLFDRRKSNAKKIDFFIKTYDNSDFFNSDFLSNNDFSELYYAECKMFSSIKRREEFPSHTKEIETVIVSILKANYSRLLQLSDIYKLPGAAEVFDNNTTSEGKTKALTIYNTISNDINTFIDFVESEIHKTEKMKIAQKEAKELEKKENDKRLLKNSIDLL